VQRTGSLVQVPTPKQHIWRCPGALQLGFPRRFRVTAAAAIQFYTPQPVVKHTGSPVGPVSAVPSGLCRSPIGSRQSHRPSHWVYLLGLYRQSYRACIAVTSAILSAAPSRVPSPAVPLEFHWQFHRGLYHGLYRDYQYRQSQNFDRPLNNTSQNG
jgi:hypothetical protein